jgi:RuvB-like protein 2
MVQIPLTRPQVSDVTPVSVERSGAHSHVRGLGLDESLQARLKSEGLVGQLKARRALGVVMQLIKRGKIAGRAILLAGKPGTGKTALAQALSYSLGLDTPFTSITGSEVFSLEMNKTEALTQALRRSIGVKIHEVAEVCEGEVVSLEIEAPSGDTTTRTGSITLKTTDMESVFDLGPRMIEQLGQQGIQPGDVISIDVAGAKVSRLGRSFAHVEDFDAPGPGVKYVHTPDGELKTRRETVHTLTLHEIDVVNSRSQGFLALFSGDTGEIKQEVREHVNQQVAQWQDEKKGELLPGVLFIDEVHMLDQECFSFLNRAIESESSPILIMASNRGIARVRGTSDFAPHGIPMDLAQRLLIIPTVEYSEPDLSEILQMRCQDEDVNVSEQALSLLVETAKSVSLRYAMQLITVSAIGAARRGEGEEVQMEDVETSKRLFISAEASRRFLDDLAMNGERSQYIIASPRDEGPPVGSIDTPMDEKPEVAISDTPIDKESKPPE